MAPAHHIQSQIFPLCADGQSFWFGMGRMRGLMMLVVLQAHSQAGMSLWQI